MDETGHPRLALTWTGTARRRTATALLDGVPLTSDEAGYVEAARAANTLRRYRSSGWREFSSWCAQRGADPMPAAGVRR